MGRDWSRLRSELAERYAEVTALKSNIVNVAAQMETHLQREQLLAVPPSHSHYPPVSNTANLSLALSNKKGAPLLFFYNTNKHGSKFRANI